MKKKATLLIITCITFLLVSCGGSKRAKQSQPTVHSADEEAVLNENIPEIEDLPIPDKEPKIHFKSAVERYIYQYKAVAKEEMATYGIPASITLAQGILESNAGRSELTRKSNNHFGIKCHGWKGKKVYHDDDKRHECFRKYKNPLYSFRDHSLFLVGRSRYNRLFDLPLDDYKGWARGLKAAGYATDPTYPRKLIGLIKRYKLYKYDKQVIRMLKATDNFDKFANNDSPTTQKSGPAVYVVKKGDTLYSIAQRFGLSVEALKRENNLRSNLISVGQRLDVRVH